LQIIHLDHDGPARALANHGTSTGYRIHRVVVNRWHLVKHDGHWFVKSRTLLPIDGTDSPRTLLRNGLAPILAARSPRSSGVS
jgi:hypothetical protein